MADHADTSKSSAVVSADSLDQCLDAGEALSIASDKHPTNDQEDLSGNLGEAL